MTEPSPSSRPVGLLAELPKAVLDHLLDAATAHTFEPDSTILQEGGPSGDCFLVQSGSVQVLTVRSDGSRVILARLGPGELFGEQAMLAGPQGRRSATVRAVETTRVLQIPQQHMLETLRALPTLHRRWVRLGQEQRQFNEAHRAEIMDDLVTLTENTDEFPIHTYEAGQVILERGAPSDAFYLLAAGRVEVRRSGRVLARLKAGDFFGILGILNQTPRYATIIALDAVTAVEFQPSAIQEPVTPALKRHLERRMRVYSLPSGAVLKQSTLEQDDRHWVESIRSQRDGQYVRSLYDPQTGDVLCGLAADPDISLAVNILKYQSHALDMHRKVWLDEDARIVGAEARGGWSQLPQVLDAILNETTIDRADVEQFPRSGELALDLGTDAAMVCVCMQVRRDTIMTCIQGGAEDPETLMQTLGCGTVCGSCVLQLHGLLGTHTKQTVEGTIRRAAQDVLTIQLQKPDEQPLSPARAGQHIILSVQINGLWFDRPYTLISPAGVTDYYEVAMQYVPTGQVTESLFDLSVQKRNFRVSPPRGSFVWEPSDRPAVFFSAGIGVTPAIAILRTARRHDRSGRLVLDCSFRRPDRGVFIDELERAAERDWIDVRIRWTETDGRLTRQEIRERVQALPEAQFFLCGPASYMEFVRTELVTAGVTSANILEEVFIPATMKERAAAPQLMSRAGYWGGLICAGFILAFLSSAAAERLVMPGPENTGHADVACVECHQRAPGTTRQQIQANLSYWLGQRAEEADFGFLPIDNGACDDCHVNPDDTHPAFRFLEPRFAEVRVALGPERCTSCHREHAGVRSQADPDQCRHCHEDLDFEEDPLDVSHATLVASERWETCLGCHDFHGNHDHASQTRLEDAFSPTQVQAYLDGGPSIYGPRIHEATRPTKDDP